jgi:hypothetical protein
MRIVSRETFSTERRGTGAGDSFTMTPDDLLEEWLNAPEQQSRSNGRRKLVPLRLISVQQIEFSSRADTPNSFEQTCTYLVVFSTED